MTLTLIGRAILFLGSLALIVTIIEVAASSWAGRWDAKKAAVIAVSVIALLTPMHGVVGVSCGGRATGVTYVL